MHIEYRTDPTTGVLLGLIGPPILLVWAIYLAAGIKDHSRRERGQCLRCGYDLKFKYESGCPECGWRRT